MSRRIRSAGLHVVFLARTMGFPEGMAATNRVRLLARAMIENGAHVRVICTHVSERPPEIRNTQAKGVYKGINFEYSTGTTVRSEYFIKRRYIELKALRATVFRVIRLRRLNQLDCLYMYGATHKAAVDSVVYRVLARSMRIPIIIELTEKPWSLQGNRSILSRYLSPLWGANGVIAISDFLHQWALAESSRHRYKLSVLQIPIVVDVKEQQLSNVNGVARSVLFAATASYHKTVSFILNAMVHVWDKLPDCRLVITGCQPGDFDHGQLAQRLLTLIAEGRVRCTGYLGRGELLAAYGTSSALLAPLFDDLQSTARFPTKIGEYLASGRPIVTTNVGEVRRYFKDGVNAFICQPDEAQLFGEKIIEAVTDSKQALHVGQTGRKLAEERFHYEQYGQPLVDFLKACVASEVQA